MVSAMRSIVELHTDLSGHMSIRQFLRMYWDYGQWLRAPYGHLYLLAKTVLSEVELARRLMDGSRDWDQDCSMSRCAACGVVVVGLNTACVCVCVCVFDD